MSSSPMLTGTEAAQPKLDILGEVGLTPFEGARVRELVGREPNALEWAMFGAMWSEHCAYKHSKKLLRTLPTKGPHVALGPGENAGAVDIGDGQLCAFKVESHNHPSAVEPYQGAATGVGGILRDVFAMGARPVAVLNALFFGPPSAPRARRLLSGVVGGISYYGNCVGIPDVGGHVSFEPCYLENPLVNAMCVGLTCASSEVAARSGVGMRIDVDNVPRRAKSMTPYEVMLSESQERMLVIARPGREGDVERIFRHWELQGVRIGAVTAEEVLTISSGAGVVATLPPALLADEAPEYDVSRWAAPPRVAGDTLPDRADVAAAAGNERPLHKIGLELLDLLA